jgi:hypothetical protein
MSGYKTKLFDDIGIIRDKKYKEHGERMNDVDKSADRYLYSHSNHVTQVLEEWIENGCKGERPASPAKDTDLIDGLADLYLYEELTDTDADKITNNEFPFMSERQLARRVQRSAPMTAAAYVGTDGRDYRYPIRRKRSTYELLWLDANRKAHNKERRDQYNKFIKPQPITRKQTNKTEIERYLNEKYTFWQRKYA